jgi:hypothetical protein
MARCKRLTDFKEELRLGNEKATEQADLDAQTAGKDAPKKIPVQLPVPANHNPNPSDFNQPDVIPPNRQTNANQAAPVDFHALALAETAKSDVQQAELKRLLMVTKGLKNDVDELKKVTEVKETQVQTLQSKMGQMQTEDNSLHNEIGSKPSVLDLYYRDVFESHSNTRAIIDFNKTPPSEIALEGALTILKPMYVKLLELASARTRQLISFMIGHTPDSLQTCPLCIPRPFNRQHGAHDSFFTVT